MSRPQSPGDTHPSNFACFSHRVSVPPHSFPRPRGQGRYRRAASVSWRALPRSREFGDRVFLGPHPSIPRVPSRSRHCRGNPSKFHPRRRSFLRRTMTVRGGRQLARKSSGQEGRSFLARQTDRASGRRRARKRYLPPFAHKMLVRSRSVSAVQYRGNAGSISCDQQSMPPARLLTSAKPWPRSHLATCRLRTPWWQ